jgi:hypothetical protein
MLPVEGKDLLRIAVLSGVIGFAAFCLSYGLFVWRKRNAANGASRPREIRAAQIFALLGCAGIALSWAFNEFQGRNGIAGGSDIFVVHARRESAAQNITAADTVEKGDVVAEFLSPADRTRVAAVEVQQAQARAKREAIQDGVLQIDEALLQEQAHLRSELLQLKGFAFELRKTRLEIERDRAGIQMTWTREEAELLENIASAEREFATAVSQRELTQRALQRGQELQKQNYMPQREVEQRVSGHLAADLNVRKNKEGVALLKERRQVLERRFGENDRSYHNQIAEIAGDYKIVQAAIAAVETRIASIDSELRQDRMRAVSSRRREAEAVDYDIAVLSAERTRLTEIGQVRAPFSGKVIYRHPAPGLAPENSPILAISIGAGFTAKIRLPARELEELRASRDAVQLALENPLLHNFFMGRFVRAEAVPFEPNRIIAYFDCSLPAEIIDYLGRTAEPVRARLLWRPSLINQPGFQISLFLLAASVLALAAAAGRSGVRRPVRSQIKSSSIVLKTLSREGDYRSLAILFRQQLCSRQLDPELLTEIERMLDRNQREAVCVLCEEVRQDKELARAAEEWMRRQDEQMRRRLAAILNVARSPVDRDDG